MTRPEFDLLYPGHTRAKSDFSTNTNESITSRPFATDTNHAASQLNNEDTHQGDDDSGLLLEAYVHRSRSEELEKRLNLLQGAHFSATTDLQAR